jgi:hypothetical protein
MSQIWLKHRQESRNVLNHALLWLPPRTHLSKNGKFSAVHPQNMAIFARLFPIKSLLQSSSSS